MTARAVAVALAAFFFFVAISVALEAPLENEGTIEEDLPPLEPFLSHALSDHADCRCRHLVQNQLRSTDEYTFHHSVPKSGARIFYLVVIHDSRTLEDSVFLFRAIRDPKNIIAIHFDTKFDFKLYLNSTLRQEIEACPCGSVVQVARVHDAKWGSWSMNLPTFWGMTKAVREHKGKWDVFINLSGDTLPVYRNDRIAEMFAGPLYGINFITSSACESGLVPTPIDAFPKHWHKRGHYSQNPMHLDYTDADGKKHHNVTLRIHFGSQWMALQPAWCTYLINELDRPESLPSQFRDYLIETEKLMTDETFIPTLLVHLFPNTMPALDDDDFSIVSLEPKMFAIRYERMDENVPSSTGWYPTEQRYDVPESSGVSAPRPWGPYFLGTYDLGNIRDSGALYVRKVSRRIDHNLPRLLPVDVPEQIPDITWPKEVKLSPVPDWEKRILEWKRHRQREAEKKKEAERKKQEEETKEDDEDLR